MPNLAKIIAAHNTKVHSEDKVFERQREQQLQLQRGTVNCLIEGARCQDSNILY